MIACTRQNERDSYILHEYVQPHNLIMCPFCRWSVVRGPWQYLAGVFECERRACAIGASGDATIMGL